MKTRLARQSDLPKIVDIYNQTIDSRMVTADTEAQSVDSKQSWFEPSEDTKHFEGQLNFKEFLKV